MPAPFATKYVDASGTILHVLHTGPTTLPGVAPALDRGRLFVLLHPAGGTAGMWAGVLRGLAAAGQSALAVDLPGHGRSPGLDAPPTIDAAAALVAALAEALRLPRFVLVGHGVGAAIALALASRSAPPLAGLALVGGATVAGVDATIASLREVVRGRAPRSFSPEAFSPSAAPAVAREWFTELVKTDPRVQLGDLEAGRAFDPDVACRAVRVPALVVVGADDRVTPPDRARELAARIAGAAVRVVPDAGHAVPVERPEAVVAALVEHGW